jgi:hypothetical protein
MKYTKAIVLALISLTSIDAVFANGQVTGAHIIRLQINTTVGNYVFIETDMVPSSPASCSVNGLWQFTLNLANSSSAQIYAGLVSAYTTRTPVMLLGVGAAAYQIRSARKE